MNSTNYQHGVEECVGRVFPAFERWPDLYGVKRVKFGGGVWSGNKLYYRIGSPYVYFHRDIRNCIALSWGGGSVVEIHSGEIVWEPGEAAPPFDPDWLAGR